ncbi:hypothetical protein EVAR_57656_1 [Eumeta japonica]|uniref:Uncharacterized protein n=1 Tax=Eumeta variegata TaxID=151549 RepID=A0A4C1YZL9_EUMVA|nr:hypothetical protein EVAR_57656_1 [Eumeta japonica]
MTTSLSAPESRHLNRDKRLWEVLSEGTGAVSLSNNKYQTRWYVRKTMSGNNSTTRMNIISYKRNFAETVASRLEF